ncbi:MAG: copper resistance protein B [Rhodospirillaceae bacterium]|nr:copper resistance protein B [Rhodospirillaceae bacterium]
MPELKRGAGISSLEAELRLRYEIRREFAPYIGVTFERKVGQTATFARAQARASAQPASSPESGLCFDFLVPNDFIAGDTNRGASRWTTT